MNADSPPVIPVVEDAYLAWDVWPQQRIGVRAHVRSTYDRTGGNRTADASHFLYQVAEDFNATLPRRRVPAAACAHARAQRNPRARRVRTAQSATSTGTRERSIGVDRTRVSRLSRRDAARRAFVIADRDREIAATRHGANLLERSPDRDRCGCQITSR
jgi:hypothetical protein